MSNVAINILAEFTGKKAFDKAGKSTSNLEKQVGNLGKKIAAAFSVTAITAYSKASVNAFLEAEKANQRLAIVVKNLGLAFETSGIQRNLDEISAKSGIAGEILTDAFQPLLTTTGSVAKSQELLNLALDVAAGTGKDVVTVSRDLALAYTGVTRGLRRYNLGLTQAELKAADFAKVQGLLNDQFSGSQSAFLATYAGQMQVITEATEDLSEAIGQALVSSFVAASGSDGVGGFVTRINTLSSKIRSLSDEILLFGVKARAAFSFEGLLKGQNFIDKAVDDARRELQYRGARAYDPGNNAVTGFKRDEAARKKAEADAAKRAKELAKLTQTQVKAAKALTAEQRRQAQAKKQSALFDLDQIALVAALQNNLSEDERLRVRLQLALLTENTSEADRLSKRLANSIDSTGQLAKFLQTMPDARNPFEAWDVWLKNFSKNLANATGSAVPTTTGAITPAPSAPKTNVVPFDDSMRVGSMASLTRKESFTDADFDRAVNITLQIDGKTIASAMQDQSLSGNNTSVNRTYGGFAGFM